MAKSKEIKDLDTITRRYQSGESANHLAFEIGIKGETLIRRLKANGVAIRSRSEAQRIPISNLQGLIGDYLSGKSLNQISKETGIERNVLTDRFKRAGVKLRNQSQAEKLKWEKLKDSPRAVRRQLQAAWEVSRGRIDTEESKATRAQTRHRHKTHIGRYENELSDMLQGMGLKVVQQLPIKQYNCDIAIPDKRIIIEIAAAGWTGRPNREYLAKRTSCLVNNNWFVLYVVTTRGTGKQRQSVFEFPLILEKIAFFLNLFDEGRLPIGQYAIIMGDTGRVPDYMSLEGLPRFRDYSISPPNHVYQEHTIHRQNEVKNPSGKWQAHIERLRIVMRGELNPARLYRDRLPRGEDHFSHKNPECILKGEQVGNSKLKEKDVKKALAMFADGKSGKEVAKAMGISKSNAYKIKYGYIWKHLHKCH